MGEQLPPSTPPLRIVIRSYREPDVLGPLVAHCWAQGAERVVVLDDRSGDNSADIARAAGAEVREDPPAIDDREERGRTWVMALLDEDPTDAWWFALDADEFPVAPWGLTVAEFLRTLPDDVDTVGCHALEHFPAPGGPTSVEQLIDAGAGAGARWADGHICPRAHWKHSLLRRRPGDPLRWRPSFHDVFPRGDGSHTREAGVPLLLHHLRWRDLGEKRRYLERVVADPRRAHRNKAQQLDALAYIERGRFDLHRDPRPTFRRWGVVLASWQDLAYTWGFPGANPPQNLRVAIWGGDEEWRLRLLRISDDRPYLEVVIPGRIPDPARFDITVVPTPTAADQVNERFRRTTEAGLWVFPETWDDEGLARLLAGAIMDASAGAAQGLGSPFSELRFQFQRIPRDPILLARKLVRRPGRGRRS